MYTAAKQSRKVRVISRERKFEEEKLHTSIWLTDEACFRCCSAVVVFEKVRVSFNYGDTVRSFCCTECMQS